MPKPVDLGVEKSPCVRELEAALERYLAAGSRRDKLDIEKEIAAILKTQKGLDAWQALLDADRDTTTSVPRATSRDRSCHRRKAKRPRWARDFRGEFDHKRAQVKDDE